MNGKVYIGAHKTKNLNDNYYGSGKYLKRAIEKYGINSFEKEILFIFNNSIEMFAKEAELVNENFITEENTYNLKKGGFGGFDYVNGTCHNNKSNHRQTGNHGFRNFRPIMDEIMKEKIRKTVKLSYLNGKINAFKGKSHTDETKKLISMKISGKQKGIKNSQFNTMWITNGIENSKIDKTFEIPEGWRKGRTMRL